ncbi:HupE/UreJ family protein [Hydrogenophilus islandicus]|jgi:urease accessory protein
MHSSKRWFVAFFFSPALAWAHVGAHPVSGFFSGLIHPLTGLDHLLAMVAVGLWAGLMGGSAWWRLPIAFVAALVAGFWVALEGLVIPAAETGVQLTLLGLGLLLAAAVRFPQVVAILVVAFFGLFHGYVHGLEVPGSEVAVVYTMGMGVTSLALHLSGVALAHGLVQLTRGKFWAVRTAGMAIAGVGAVLLAS